MCDKALILIVLHVLVHLNRSSSQYHFWSPSSEIRDVVLVALDKAYQVKSSQVKVY